MMFRAAIVLIALAAPAIAQRGGGHAGSFGGHGSAGHAGFSGSSGFSRAGSFARPARPVQFGSMGSVGLRGTGRPNYSQLPIPYNGNRFVASRAPYRLGDAGLSRTGAGGGDRGRGPYDSDRRNSDPRDARRRSYERWYLSNFPTGLGYGYPYVIDPGFYDWGDSDNSENDQSSAAPEYPVPYQDNGYGAPGEPPQEGFAGEVPPWNSQSQQPAGAGATVAPMPRQLLTVIFKGGRAPVKMENYMMTAKVLTDLDSQHYEQIPLDQIDFAATRQVNGAADVGFQIPGASRD